jgi:hypothetical protein
VRCYTPRSAGLFTKQKSKRGKQFSFFCCPTSSLVSPSHIDDFAAKGL